MQKNHIQIHPAFSSFFSERLFMTREAYVGFISQLVFSDKNTLQVEMPTYEEQSLDIANQLSSEDIRLTRSFNETDITDNSIAFHRVTGPIIAEYNNYWRWYFSTKQFIDDIRAADKNPQIIAHFCFMNSGGGEAWYLEKAYEAVGKLKKPIITFVEKHCCSAGYYIACNTDRIFSTSINDTIGSIGTMVSFLDIIPYFEKMGLNYIEEYADQSTLKNKKFNLLLDGKPKKYKEKELNPLADQFISAVRSARGSLAKLPIKHDVFAGETYSAQESRSVGLIDEIAELEFALNYTLQQGKKSKAKIEKQVRMKQLID